MQTVQALQTILEMGLPDRAIQSDELPWVPQTDRVWFKPLRFDLTNGRWINILKVTGGGRVNRHRHSGGLFDATSGVLRRAWDFKQARVPADA